MNTDPTSQPQPGFGCLGGIIFLVILLIGVAIGMAIGVADGTQADGLHGGATGAQVGGFFGGVVGVVVAVLFMAIGPVNQQPATPPAPLSNRRGIDDFIRLLVIVTLSLFIVTQSVAIHDRYKINQAASKLSKENEQHNKQK